MQAGQNSLKTNQKLTKIQKILNLEKCHKKLKDSKQCFKVECQFK